MSRRAPAALAKHDADAAVFSALAHPTRREMLLILNFRGGTMSAGEIAARFSCRWPTVTRHLQVLERAGLLSVTKRGRTRVYRLKRRVLLDALDGWRRWFGASKPA
ncbi:MAG TPA: metalloregulator ArsR/SmtB family transcription factor [Candidatus Acidoferrales bacterium]|nr:metalloregulator ArsR/SmtB family transcription factor [Candidatus Acidoferrales bacterium]